MRCGSVWSWSAEAHHCWSEEHEGNPTSYGIDHCRVALLLMIGNHRCKSLIHHMCSRSHPTWGGKHQWGKRTEFHFSYSLIVGSSFFLFLLPIQGWDRWGAQAWCNWVENPNVKKCMLPGTPKIFCNYIKSCSVLSISWSVQENFGGQWLKWRFHSYSFADFIHELCSYVSYFVVSFDGNAAMVTAHSMFCIKCFTTNAMAW